MSSIDVSGATATMLKLYLTGGVIEDIEGSKRASGDLKIRGPTPFIYDDMVDVEVYPSTKLKNMEGRKSLGGREGH